MLDMQIHVSLKTNDFGFVSTTITNIPKGKFPEAIPLLNHFVVKCETYTQ